MRSAVPHTEFNATIKRDHGELIDLVWARFTDLATSKEARTGVSGYTHTDEGVKVTYNDYITDQKVQLSLSSDAGVLLDALLDDRTVDQLVQELGWPVEAVQAGLVALEQAGLVYSEEGRYTAIVLPQETENPNETMAAADGMQFEASSESRLTIVSPEHLMGTLINPYELQAIMFFGSGRPIQDYFKTFGETQDIKLRITRLKEKGVLVRPQLREN
jgi:hypothetical protein